MRHGGPPRIVWTRAAVLLIVLLGAVGSARCSRGHALTNTLESPEAVARAVLNGLTVRDVSGLRSLAVTEQEFRDVVWPKLPTSRPGRNIPWDYAWKDLHGKCVMQLQARVNEWEDSGFTFVRITFAGDSTDYRTFRIRRESVVTLRDRDGHETQRQLFGSLIEQNGRYKVFSYVVD